MVVVGRGGATQVVAKLPAIAHRTVTTIAIPIASMYKVVVIIRSATESTAAAVRGRSGHPELGGRICHLVTRRGGWWWLNRGRRVPRIQPRIDPAARLVTVHRVPVLVDGHRATAAAARRRRHGQLVGGLQVLLRAVELAPGKVRAGRSGPLRNVLLGTVQGVFGIAGTIKVRISLCIAPTIKSVRGRANRLDIQILQRLRRELVLGPRFSLLFPAIQRRRRR